MFKYKVQVFNPEAVLSVDYIVTAKDITSAKVLAGRNEMRKFNLNPIKSSNPEDTFDYAHNKGIWVYKTTDLTTGRTF